jgi:hypothetical protein
MSPRNGFYWRNAAERLVGDISSTLELLESYQRPEYTNNVETNVARLWTRWYAEERKLARFLLYNAPDTTDWIVLKINLLEVMDRADAAFIAFWEDPCAN